MAAPKKTKKKNKKKSSSVKGVGSKTGSMSTTLVKRKSKKSAEIRSKTPVDHTIHAVVPQRKGLGMAAKMTFFIVILLGLIITVTVTIDFKRVMKNYVEGLDAQGVRLCEALLVERRFLDVTEGDIGLLNLLDHMLNTYSTFTDNEFQELTELRKKNKDKVLNAGKMIEQFKTNEVIQILYSQGEETVYGGGSGGSMTKSFQESIDHLQHSGVIVFDGVWSQGGVETVVRSYELSRQGFNIQVIISSEKIKELESGMRNMSILIAVISIAVGVLGVSILAHQITKPINQLAEDMLIVARGKLGHLSRVTSTDEVGVLAKTFNLMSKDLDISHEAELQKIEQDRDLELAKNVQISLVPTKIPSLDNFSIAPFYRSAKEVGGDYYDIVEMDAEHTALFVADVSGKGVQGAMIMAMTRGIAHSETKACTNFSPSWILSQVNRNLARDLKPGSFVTAMCLIINKRTGICKLASAGHNPLVIVRHKSKTWENFNPTGIALGFDKGPLFNRTIKDEELTLNLGDRVVLYTDGVVEAMSEDKEEYGMQRFKEFCVKYAGLKSSVFVTQLINELDRHKGGASQHDDITVIALRKLR